MLDLERRFNGYVKRMGGIYTNEDNLISRIRSEFDNKLMIYHAIHPDVEFPRIYLGVINYDRFRAMAFKDGEDYFIGISIGTIRSLFNFFQYLMSKPFYKKEFHSENEIDNVLLLEEKRFLIDYFYSYDFNIRPVHEERRVYAEELFYKAISYLLMHELAHITHGHLDCNIATDQDFMLFEDDKIFKKNTNIRKGLEYDADCAATTISIAPNFMGMYEELFIRNDIEMLIPVMFSLFKLNALNDYRVEDLKYRTYPAPDLRLVNNMATIYTYLNVNKEALGFDTSHLYDVIKYSQIEIFAAFNKVFGKDALEDKIFYFSSNQSMEFIWDVQKGWNEIRDKLVGYSMFPVQPKDTLFSEGSRFDYQEIVNKRREKNVDNIN